MTEFNPLPNILNHIITNRTPKQVTQKQWDSILTQLKTAGIVPTSTKEVVAILEAFKEANILDIEYKAVGSTLTTLKIGNIVNGQD